MYTSTYALGIDISKMLDNLIRPNMKLHALLIGTKFDDLGIG